MHRKRDTKTSTIFSVRRGGWLLWAVPFVNKNWTGHGATALLCFRECPCHQNASPGDGADLTLRNTLPQPQHAHLFQDIQKPLLWSRHKWCHASDKESGWEYLQRESLQFTVFRVRFQLSSHFNRPLILSPNNLSLCLPQNWGVQVSGLCSAAQSKSSLCICCRTCRAGLCHWAGSSA